MNFFIDLVRNPVFLAAGGAWLAAQLSKIIYETIRNGFHPGRLTGGGGMPSSHSATMTGLTMGCLLSGTARSPEFAVSLFAAMVVIYDAMGVRYETGKQSKILNRMRQRDIEEGREPLFDKPLDEKMGHTLAEVIVGIAVGIGIALIMCLWAAPLIDGALTAAGL
jgi:acid phosphatase family membrane protein YuiD